MRTLQQKLTFNWKTNLTGLVSVVYGVVVLFNEPTLVAAVHDSKLHMALLVAVLGFVAKDCDSSGTATAPLESMTAINNVAATNNVSVKSLKSVCCSVDPDKAPDTR